MEEQILCGERPLLADEVTFVYGVHRQEERLQFTMQNDVATDEVFGMEPGRDDDVTMFACYDLKRGEVCGTLDVKVFEDDGSKTYFLYSLNAEERALLRQKMDTYSIEKTGMSLQRHGEVYRLEQEGDIPPPDSVRHDTVTMLKRQEALSGDVADEEIRNDSGELKRVNRRQPGRNSRGGKGRKTRRREQNR